MYFMSSLRGQMCAIIWHYIWLVN